MSTASQRRKARRLALQAPFAEKVRSVALSLPRRSPAPVDGMRFVERIEALPGGDHEFAPHPRRKVWLKAVVGDECAVVPRRFFIPYGEASPAYWSALDVGEREVLARHQVLEFTWRQWAVRAGDTEVRWLTPELTGPGASEESHRPFYAARKAAALAARAIADLSIGGRNFLAGPIQQTLHEARGAIEEWLGVLDPDETRAERERQTNAEVRRQW